MTTNIEIKYRYNDKEIKRAVSFWLLRISSKKRYFHFIYLGLLLVMVCSALTGYFPLFSMLLLVGGALFHYYYYERVIKTYNIRYKKRNGLFYCFTDENIRIDSNDTQSTASWSEYKEAYDIPSAFLLINENSFVDIFPKSCFGEAQKTDAFRDIISKNIPGFTICK